MPNKVIDIEDRLRLEQKKKLKVDKAKKLEAVRKSAAVHPLTGPLPQMRRAVRQHRHVQALHGTFPFLRGVPGGVR